MTEITKGSEKQIAWATDIQANYDTSRDTAIVEAAKEFAETEGAYQNIVTAAQAIAGTIDDPNDIVTSAEFWIDNRNAKSLIGSYLEIAWNRSRKTNGLKGEPTKEYRRAKEAVGVAWSTIQ